MPIAQAVGPAAPNRAEDVLAVQQRLAAHRQWIGTVPAATGQFDALTAAAIVAFQRTACALLTQDGVVSPRGFTIRRLDTAYLPQPAHRVFADMCWRTGPDLTPADFTAAATALACEVAAIRAVAEVETKRAAFDEVGRPTILFERHYFARLSGHAFDATHPDIANSAAGGYGRFSAQYPKLKRAATLDEAAALKSASWGMFQIMGANHAAAGHGTVAGFVDAMMTGPAAHLAAFVAFIRADATLLRALRARDWPAFARGYNGPGYARNNYDVEMRNAYARLTAR
jgi:hypothetical protein